MIEGARAGVAMIEAFLHVMIQCSCGASVVWGDLATQEDLDAWSAEHGAHEAVRIEAPVWNDVVLGLSVLGQHEAFPRLRGRAVILQFFGRPSKATTEAVLAELAEAGAVTLGVDGGYHPMNEPLDTALAEAL
jgi:hypothetical protein